MNRTYRLIWNKTYFCWQAVSELAKSTTASKQSPSRIKSKATLSLITKRIGLLTINLLSASIALAGPTGGVVSSGAATISTTGSTTTINQSTAKAAIDWSSFSSNSNEAINFVQPNSSSITLNRVTGNSISTLNGQLNANGQVFIINPNGVLFGSTSQVNTGGLVASTLNLSNSDFNNNDFKFSNAANNKTVENRGKITVPVGGTVALIAPSVRQTGTIKAPQGNVLLAAGGDITLNLNNGSLLGYTINQGKAQALINSGGMIQADGGKVILTAKGLDELSNAVVNSVGVVQAQTVNNVRGVIELGSDLVSGTVNVSGILDASAPTSGNGGQIKTTASNVQISTGTNITTQRNTTSSLPPTTSGWELQAKNIDIDFFGGSVSSTTLGNALNKGNVTLSAVGTGDAQGIINLNDATNWSNNTALTLNATKDINFNSDLDLSGDKAKLAMNYGVGSDYNLNNRSKINITGSAPTLLINGTSYVVINDLGEEGDASINTLQGMRNNLSGNYALGSNIDATDTVNWNNGDGFEPIGELEIFIDRSNDSFEKIDKPYIGQFHGLGHSVNNLNINLFKDIPEVDRLTQKYSMNAAGMFGNATNTLRDIGLVEAKIAGLSLVGSLVAYMPKGTVKNAYASNVDVVGEDYVGGLIGQVGNEKSKSLILSSYATGIVNGISNTGGLIGYAENLMIKDSHSNIVINSMQSLQNITVGIGGLVGGVTDGSISNSYANGNVTGGSTIGGLVGSFWLKNTDSHRIENSYATGQVLAEDTAGGLIGSASTYYFNKTNLTIDNSYATGNVVTNSLTYGGTGGLIGIVSSSPEMMINISNSYATGNVSSNSYRAGGLVGSLWGAVSNSYATGQVKGNQDVGGLIGANYQGIVKNSFSTSSVDGNVSIGGLIGSNTGVIETSYSTGIVVGVAHTGGLIGGEYYTGGTVLDSFWNIETSGQTQSAGGEGKTTAELRKIMTFTGWDIADVSDLTSNSIWVIDENNKTPWLRYNH
ncbi:two-partner secretion domain-containing protein [Acinetobacter sp. AS167]|uniref:two-partner secretion domain-containing protein n=1 Tax=Acinetobacter sp. AS167 TaxID=3127884 RepID=UPI0030159474